MGVLAWLECARVGVSPLGVTLVASHLHQPLQPPHLHAIQSRIDTWNIYILQRNGDRSMRGSIWSDLGHLGLPDLVVSTFVDASNSHVDGKADKPSDSRLEVSLSCSYSYIRTVTH